MSSLVVLHSCFSLRVVSLFFIYLSYERFGPHGSSFLFVIGGLWFVGCAWWLCVVRCLLFVVCWALCARCCVLLDACCLLCVGVVLLCWWSVVSWLLVVGR